MHCGRPGRGRDAPDDLPDQIVDGYRNSPADSINSIHADRLAGRPTEADARNGVIARLSLSFSTKAEIGTGHRLRAANFRGNALSHEVSPNLSLTLPHISCAIVRIE